MAPKQHKANDGASNSINWEVPADGYCLYNSIWNWAIDNYHNDDRAKTAAANWKELAKSYYKTLYAQMEQALSQTDTASDTYKYCQAILSDIEFIKIVNFDNIRTTNKYLLFNAAAKGLKLLLSLHYAILADEEKLDTFQQTKMDKTEYTLETFRKALITNGSSPNYTAPINIYIDSMLLTDLFGASDYLALLRYGICYTYTNKGKEENTAQEEGHYSYIPQHTRIVTPKNSQEEDFPSTKRQEITQGISGKRQFTTPEKLPNPPQAQDLVTTVTHQLPSKNDREVTSHKKPRHTNQIS